MIIFKSESNDDVLDTFERSMDAIVTESMQAYDSCQKETLNSSTNNVANLLRGVESGLFERKMSKIRTDLIAVSHASTNFESLTAQP